MPFRIYVDLESLLKGVQRDKGSNASYTKKYQAHIPCSSAHKVVCIADKFSKLLFFTEEKMQSIHLLKQFLMSMIIVKKILS